MSFCPTCGRPRTAGSRFCDGCGREFREPAADDGTAPAAGAPGEATRLDLPADATRVDAPVDATRLEWPPGGSAWAEPREPGPPAEPDPFAAWYAPEAPAPPAGPPAAPRAAPDRWQAAPDRWQTADTVYAAPSPAAGYRPPPQPGPGFPPAPGSGFPPPGPPYGGPGRRPSRGGRAALIIVAVLVVLGAGGAAYAYISRSGTRSAGAPSTATTSAAPSARPGAGTGARSASASPPASAPASASPAPSLVSVASGVGSNPATPQVETVLSHFFQGINTHSYSEYSSALDPQQRAAQTRSSFSKGYSTSTDSGMTLTSLAGTGGGGLAATVTFTSHQAASSSVDNSTCNHWTLTFYLVPSGPGYLDGAAPAGYQPHYSDC